MKLFISYGHGTRDQDFVRRIKGDLESGGDPCWIDSEQIDKQPDWRRSLMDALLIAQLDGRVSVAPFNAAGQRSRRRNSRSPTI